ncbi:MAG: transglycosylase SLT domain-containing protein [Acidobacteriales bacterium]|nr:transglycosylase SLT domain-containing protein [Terriglobales bacterium]
MRRITALLSVAALGLLTSACEEKKPARTAPPPAAMAPSITAAEPNKMGTPAPAQNTKPAEPTQAEMVEGVVQRAQQLFHAGENEYQAGHLASARANFDRAVDTFLQSPVDLRTSARLRDEFERIVDSIHRLEMVALKEGDGFTEQRSDPAPIDEAAELTFPVDPNLRAKVEAELRTTRSDLPLMINDYVAGYIHFFTNTTKGRNTVLNAWRRAGRYQEMIRRVLREQDVPEDLFYLAQAESGFKPLAVSRVGARGMWQFMHYTAPLYGLRKNWWVDERQDPEKSTRAAARHLKDLYNQFGDWYLAMAAYNSGAGNVQRGVERTGYADFWELYKRNVLPNETKNYVPIILAMTIVAKNADQYGLSLDDPEPELAADVVPIDYALDLRLAAEAIEVPVDVVLNMNPGLLRGVTPRDMAYDLKLPAGTRETFESAIAAIPLEKRVHWRYHKVAPQESLSAIAKRYRTSERAILEVNNLTSDEIEADTKLIIPAVSDKKGPAAGGAYARKATRYKVRRGDTVLSVADDFGVPADKLRQWNKLKGNALRQGRTLMIYKPVAASSPEATPSKARKKPTGKKSAGRAGKPVSKSGKPEKKASGK